MPKTRLVLTVAFVVVLVLMAIVPEAAFAAPLDGPYAPPGNGASHYGYSSYGHNYYPMNMNHKGSACWYKVRWGDTLNKIAWRYGTSTHYLAWLNHLWNPDRIYAGQWLRVPCVVS
jgi:hypothetical protein